MKTKLSNSLLTVTIDTFGAEIQSIMANATGHEYLWNGDAAFWGRHSPVLFPLVGQVWEGKYRMDGQEYALGQHGFARDREFMPIEDCPEDEAWFTLEDDESTRQVYPRSFRLEIGYHLHEARLTVMWRVRNTDDKDLSFHIGAHPAFNYPSFSAADTVHAYLDFGQTSLHSQILGKGGCVVAGEQRLNLDSDGLLPVTAHTFEVLKTIILADGQVRRVSMLDKNKVPYLSVLFNSPLVGIWSPSALAPFICIEPWWGRCDREGFKGDFSDREYINTIAPGQAFDASYMVVFDNLTI